MLNWFLIVIILYIGKKRNIASIKTHNTYYNNKWLFDIYISTLWTYLTFHVNIAASSYKRKKEKLLYGKYNMCIRHEL